MKTKNKTLFLAQFSILPAIEAIFCFTPLGSLPAIGPTSSARPSWAPSSATLSANPWAGC
jgi:hypothetical protein